MTQAQIRFIIPRKKREIDISAYSEMFPKSHHHCFRYEQNIRETLRKHNQVRNNMIADNPSDI